MTKTLIVGGTGGVGAYIALKLREEHGHDVTIASRKAPAVGSCVADFPCIMGNYAEDDFTLDQLTGFDILIFSAAADARQVPKGADETAEADFYRKVNSQGVPRFIALAKAAGIRRAAYIGSVYAQAIPQAVEESSYVRSRRDADEGARALADETFHIVSLNAPWIVGTAPGMGGGLYGFIARWALGLMPQIPFTAPPGGNHYVSVHSVYEAVVGGLLRGENGRGYMVGDQNLYYRQLFEMIFRLAGHGDVEFELKDEPHPIQGDRSLFAGRAGTVFYAPEGVPTLGYAQNDVERTLRQIVADELAALEAKA